MYGIDFRQSQSNERTYEVDSDAANESDVPIL
jgi:hypothetical protein